MWQSAAGSILWMFRRLFVHLRMEVQAIILHNRQKSFEGFVFACFVLILLPQVENLIKKILFVTGLLSCFGE